MFLIQLRMPSILNSEYGFGQFTMPSMLRYLFLIQFTMSSMLKSEYVLDKFTMPSMQNPKTEFCWTWMLNSEKKEMFLIQKAVKQVQSESEYCNPVIH
jgi:hypothetical protein